MLRPDRTLLPNQLKTMYKQILSIIFAAVTYSATAQQINDSNTPLHLLKPDYKLAYGVSRTEDVKATMDRVLRYISSCTPAQIIDKRTGQPLTELKKIDENSQLASGTFRLTSYEWGVTYSACLAAAKATGDKAYQTYVTDRFRLLRDAAPYFRKVYQKKGSVIGNMRQVVDPHALDDCGAICAAMIKASLDDPQLRLDSLIANYSSYIFNKVYRLADGTYARTRPHHNTLWLDDMFMGIPATAYMGSFSRNSRYYDDAVRQVKQFSERMWVPERNLFRHGWVEAMRPHPAFFWGRANGWALLTLCEVLDALPADHQGRPFLLDLLQRHIYGLAALQGKDGFWHQLLDRNDSYEESSATAIYTYCIAHAINRGWVDALAYGPMVQLAWHAVASSVEADGRVTGTCVGTGMGFDPAFYMYRPVSPAAAHAYGPVIWAGAEMINLLRKQHPKMNDSAVQFYPHPIATDAPIFNADGSTKF